jgi:hypothetical protein
VDAALSRPGSGTPPVPATQLQQLARDLATSGETAAVIRLWDLLGGSKNAEPSTWAAVEELHARGKGRIPTGTLTLPPLAKRTLAPARRLHKICKGRVVSARSGLALVHLDRAAAWVATQRALGRSSFEAGGARSKFWKELQTVLGVDKETARGLATKLKRKKLI